MNSIVIIAVIIFSLFHALSAEACSCSPLKHTLKYCQRAFVGKVIAQEQNKFRLKIIKNLKGNNSGEVLVDPSLTSPCPMKFEVGRTYQVCTDHELTTDLCQENFQVETQVKYKPEAVVENVTLLIAQKLANLSQLSTADLEKILDAKFEVDSRNKNVHFTVYKAQKNAAGWRNVEARLPKHRGGTHLSLEFTPGAATGKEVLALFGKPHAPSQPYVISEKDTSGMTFFTHHIEERVITWLIESDDNVKSMIITNGR
jgi:hypothetical protein